MILIRDIDIEWEIDIADIRQDTGTIESITFIVNGLYDYSWECFNPYANKCPDIKNASV